MCLDTRYRGQTETFGIEKCVKDGLGGGGEQVCLAQWLEQIKELSNSV